jgi:hypothetical protein
MRAARLFALGAIVLAAGAMAGCSEYHYYDIDVTFNTDPASSGFGPNEVAMIQTAVFSVSGADSGSFPIGPNDQGLPLAPGFSHLGIIEFSTFKDSGTLNFKVEAYDARTLTPDCKVGEGTTSVTATSTTTNNVTLSVNKTGSFTCQ